MKVFPRTFSKEWKSQPLCILKTVISILYTISGGNKKPFNLNKPTHKSCSFSYVCMKFCHHQALKSQFYRNGIGFRNVYSSCMRFYLLSFPSIQVRFVFEITPYKSKRTKKTHLPPVYSDPPQISFCCDFQRHRLLISLLLNNDV